MKPEERIEIIDSLLASLRQSMVNGANLMEADMDGFELRWLLAEEAARFEPRTPEKDAKAKARKRAFMRWYAVCPSF